MKSNEFSKLDEGFGNFIARTGIAGKGAQLNAMRSRREELTQSATIKGVVDKIKRLIKDGENHWWDTNAGAAGGVSENKYAKLNRILESIINLNEAAGAPSLAEFVISSIKKMATDEGVKWNAQFEQSLAPMAAAIQKSFNDNGNNVDRIDTKTLENLGKWYYVLMSQYGGSDTPDASGPVKGDDKVQSGEEAVFLSTFLSQIKKVPLDGSDGFNAAIPIIAQFLATLQHTNPKYKVIAKVTQEAEAALLAMAPTPTPPPATA